MPQGIEAGLLIAACRKAVLDGPDQPPAMMWYEFVQNMLLYEATSYHPMLAQGTILVEHGYIKTSADMRRYIQGIR